MSSRFRAVVFELCDFSVYSSRKLDTRSKPETIKPHSIDLPPKICRYSVCNEDIAKNKFETEKNENKFALLFDYIVGEYIL